MNNATITLPTNINRNINANDVPVIIQIPITQTKNLSLNQINTIIANLQTSLASWQAILAQVAPVVATIPVNSVSSAQINISQNQING